MTPPTHYQCNNPMRLADGKPVMYGDVISASVYDKYVRTWDKKWFAPEPVMVKDGRLERG